MAYKTGPHAGRQAIDTKTRWPLVFSASETKAGNRNYRGVVIIRSKSKYYATGSANETGYSLS